MGEQIISIDISHLVREALGQSPDALESTTPSTPEHVCERRDDESIPTPPPDRLQPQSDVSELRPGRPTIREGAAQRHPFR